MSIIKKIKQEQDTARQQAKLRIRYAMIEKKEFEIERRLEYQFELSTKLLNK